MKSFADCAGFKKGSVPTTEKSGDYGQLVVGFRQIEGGGVELVRHAVNCGGESESGPDGANRAGVLSPPYWSNTNGWPL